MFDKTVVCEQVKMLLKNKIAELPSDDLILFLIDYCVSRVNGYCRRNELPEELYTLIPIMTVRMYEVNDYGGQGAAIKSWSQGERSENYEDSSIIRDDWLNDFISQLEPFRIRKGRVPSEIKL